MFKIRNGTGSISKLRSPNLTTGKALLFLTLRADCSSGQAQAT